MGINNNLKHMETNNLVTAGGRCSDAITNAMQAHPVFVASETEEDMHHAYSPHKFDSTNLLDARADCGITNLKA